MKALTTNPTQAAEQFVLTASDRDKAVLAERKAYVGDRTLIGFHPDFFGMVYADEMGKDGSIAAMFFKNKSAKPIDYRMFKSFDDLKTHAEKWAGHEQKRLADKAEQKLKKSAIDVKDHVAIGDVFTCSWGWEVTYIDYYQVVGFKGKKTVLLREIANKITEDGYNHSKCTPAIDKFVGDEVLEKKVDCRLNSDGVFHGSVKINDVRTAFYEHKLADGSYCEHHWSRDW